MILIRGISGEEYARQIEKGIVSCRDIISSLIVPPKTGYTYSDYLEKNLIKALTQVMGKESEDFKSPEVLYSILSDFYLPYIYISCFHIVNEKSLLWLKESYAEYDKNIYFIALNVKIDKLTQTAIGNEFFGARMQYIDKIKTQNQHGYIPFNPAVLCSIENKFYDKRKTNEAVRIYNTISFPLLFREQDSRFTDIENEFRIIAYDCPTFEKNIRKQITRNIKLFGKSGAEYKGILYPGKDYMLNSNNALLSNPRMSLHQVLDFEDGNIKLDSYFKPINIRSIASSYRFIGGIKECEVFIKKTINNPPRNVYVEKTVLKHYKWSEVKDFSFRPGKIYINY